MSNTIRSAASAEPRSSKVSVDAVTLRFNPQKMGVEVAVTTRTQEPFTGQLALPGVVLLEGERLAHAAERALRDKLGWGAPRALGQLIVFDEPARDPRGATLSVAMWAVADGPGGTWVSLDDVPPLAFDHNRIIEVCRPMLAEMLWRNLDFTRALTGPTFPVSTAIALTESLTRTVPDRGNLNRRLATIPKLRVSGREVVRGRGRPGATWSWA
ncbi:NUDIX hydrolase [Propionicicella superfundia]|uniref:NUDIX hydrolase n=1 Tax=Propionicicella superfundia TaxID=348582 RepID=UPI000684A885|nr:NUDIX hydrolase [Propionicicella superfundia]